MSLEPFAQERRTQEPEKVGRKRGYDVPHALGGTFSNSGPWVILDLRRFPLPVLFALICLLPSVRSLELRPSNRSWRGKTRVEYLPAFPRLKHCNTNFSALT